MNKGAGYVGVTLALLSILWSAATQWQELKSRVTAVEQRMMFFYGAPTATERR